MVRINAYIQLLYREVQPKPLPSQEAESSEEEGVMPKETRGSKR